MRVDDIGRQAAHKFVNARSRGARLNGRRRIGRLVDPRPHADVFVNDVAQLRQIFALELEWQVAGIGVFIGFRFTRAMKITDDLVGLRRAAHRIVEDKGGPDLVSFEDPLHLQLKFDRGDAHRLTDPHCKKS